MDDEFEPRLGRIRSKGAGKSTRFLNQVLRAAAMATPAKSGRAGKRFHGSRIGRGAGVGRVLSSRDRFAAYRQRRVIVKFRITKLGAKGLGAARAHLRYVQRDGVTREGNPGQLYDAEADRTEGSAFLGRCEGDRHQFRFIVSAEDGAEYEDLKSLTRRLMARMEQDLGTKLDWVAVDHFNTGHPHTHVILRGRTDRGQDLIIAREYLTEGMRERAAELVRLDLGVRTDSEIETRLRAEMTQERLTSLDRGLLRDQDTERLVAAGSADPFQQTLRAGRLQQLKRFGLAEDVSSGVWRLDANLETTLRRMGERGDIIKALSHVLREGNVARGAADYAIYDPDRAERPLVGRLVRRGLSDELNDRHYLVVDGVDGRAHYVDIGKSEATEQIPEGSVVSIAARRAEVRATDRAVAEIAAANDGRYSLDIHLRHDPSARTAFVETHVRRLEALRRASGVVERQADGTFVIAPDHLDRVFAHERRLVRGEPVAVQVLSSQSLDKTIRTNGATWLDRELVGDTALSLRDAGFGREVSSALAARRQWLINEDLARVEADRTVYRANLLAILQRRELARVAGGLSDELGLRYIEARDGQRIEGTYRRAVDLASGKFAVIEKSREFTLAPWRPVLERNLGQQVSGVLRDNTVSWTLGRSRGGPSVS